MAMQVRYKSLYISLPSSAKQQREMTKFCVVYGTWKIMADADDICGSLTIFIHSYTFCLPKQSDYLNKKWMR